MFHLILYYAAIAASLVFPGMMIAAIRTKDEDNKAYTYGAVSTICFFIIVFAVLSLCSR